jgi:hypothetical protein
MAGTEFTAKKGTVDQLLLLYAMTAAGSVFSAAAPENNPKPQP